MSIKGTFSLCVLHGGTGEILEESKCVLNISFVMKFDKKYVGDTEICSL